MLIVRSILKLLVGTLHLKNVFLDAAVLKPMTKSNSGGVIWVDTWPMDPENRSATTV